MTSLLPESKSNEYFIDIAERMTELVSVRPYWSKFKREISLLPHHEPKHIIGIYICPNQAKYGCTKSFIH